MLKIFFNKFIEFGIENKEYYKIMFMSAFPEEAMENVKIHIAREIEPGLKTLSKLIKSVTGQDEKFSLYLAEALFHAVHGHISLVILERKDFLFDAEEDKKVLLDMIMSYIKQKKIK